MSERKNMPTFHLPVDLDAMIPLDRNGIKVALNHTGMTVLLVSDDGHIITLRIHHDDGEADRVQLVEVRVE